MQIYYVIVIGYKRLQFEFNLKNIFVKILKNIIFLRPSSYER